MPTVLLPTPLRPYADKQKEVAVQGATVATCLADLAARHPRLKQHLFGDDGAVRPFVNVYVNDTDIRTLQRGDTAVAEQDTLHIVPSVAGGGA